MTRINPDLSAGAVMEMALRGQLKVVPTANGPGIWHISGALPYVVIADIQSRAQANEMLANLMDWATQMQSDMQNMSDFAADYMERVLKPPCGIASLVDIEYRN